MAGLDPQAVSRRQRFDELMKTGMEAYRRGEHRLAHDYWREAATLDPYSEKVWLALYRVLTSDDDRLVCLRNIIAINPANVQARRRLQLLEQRVAKGVPDRTVRPQPAAMRRTRPRSANSERLISRAVILIIIAIVLGVIGGIIASILIYGA